MKTIGILGGLGPEATIDYYKEIIKKFNELNNNESLTYPEIVIYSVTMSRFIGLLEEGREIDAADYIIECLNKIKKADASFAILSANTPHLLFDYIQSKIDLPLISIVKTCAEEAQRLDRKKCALIGTKFTMQNDFYQKTFKEKNIHIECPDEEDIELINTKLFTEMELGIFKEETKIEILGIVRKMKDRKNIDGVILGCTELPIMFTEEYYWDIPFLNTTRIHVEAIVRECTND